MSLLNLENDQTAWKPAARSRLSALPKLIHGAFIHSYIKVICMLFILSLGCEKEGMLLPVDSQKEAHIPFEMLNYLVSVIIL